MDSKRLYFFDVIIIVVVLSVCLNFAEKDLRESFIERIEENEDIYSRDIDEYNESIDEYAHEINEMGLSDLETIIKLMIDQWEDYDYGEASENINGYDRLNFQHEGKGVCRSFADDFTAKMNAINPEYDAKNLICYLNKNKISNGIEIVNIGEISTQRERQENILKELITRRYGNHMISVIHIPDKDYMLAVDSTNLTIGLIKDGKIYDFNNGNDDSLVIKEMGNYVFGGNDILEYDDTFYDMEETTEELTEDYGFDAQVKAMDNIEIKEKVLKKRY